MLRKRLTRLIVALSLAGLPAAALAQDNAGDEQYRDPLPPQQKTQKRSATTRPGSSSAPAQQQSATPPQGAGTTPPAPTSSQPSSGQGGGQGGGHPELARTGLDLRAVITIGIALLLAGLGLIRLSRRPAPQR